MTIRWLERLTHEGRESQARRDYEDAFGKFPHEVWMRLLERMDGDAALHPHEILQQIVAEEKRKHPLHWLRFRLWSRKPQKPGPIERRLQAMKDDVR